MAASVLNTSRAIETSVYVVRAFVKLRDLLSTHRELAGKVAELERKVGSHDEAIQSLVAAIRRLMEPPPTPRLSCHTGGQAMMRVIPFQRVPGGGQAYCKLRIANCKL
jgi:hypothetical protein